MNPRCWVEVDLAAIRWNAAAVRARLSAGCALLAVVKADAYGHGLVPVAQAALDGGAAALGVATTAEGAALRQAGLSSVPIHVMSALLPDLDEATGAARHRLTVWVSEVGLARALSDAADEQGAPPVAVWLKLETGMGRIGLLAGTPAELRETVCALTALPGIRLGGVVTHFASSEDDPAYTDLQLARLEALAGGLGLPLMAANSGGILHGPCAHLAMARAGLLLYGIAPDGGRLPDGLRPALSWKARLSLVRDLPAGHPISYGRSHVLARDSRVAVIPVGYADGYPRRLSNVGRVLVRGRLCPVLGRVCMDQTLIDVTDLPGAAAGDVATLLGDGLSVGDLARLIDTTPHEITTCIGPRVPRYYTR